MFPIIVLDIFKGIANCVPSCIISPANVSGSPEKDKKFLATLSKASVYPSGKLVPNLSLIFPEPVSIPIVNSSTIALSPKGTPVTAPVAMSPTISTSVSLSLGIKFLGFK